MVDVLNGLKEKYVNDTCVYAHEYICMCVVCECVSPSLGLIHGLLEHKALPV